MGRRRGNSFVSDCSSDCVSERAARSVEKTYSIGQVSELLGLPASTIRYYEGKGLIPSLTRKPSGIREFTETDIEWLRMIEHLKMSGMTISEISDFTALYQYGDETIEQRRALIHNRRDELLRQMAELQQTLDFITYKCWYYDTASEAGTCDVPHNMPEDQMPPEIAAIKRRCKITSH